FASGLLNTIGFDWHPVTGELLGMDNGIDFLGDEVQPEELNTIERGKQYGWPHIFADGGVNPQSTPPGEISKARRPAKSAKHAARRNQQSTPPGEISKARRPAKSAKPHGRRKARRWCSAMTRTRRPCSSCSIVAGRFPRST